MDKLNFFGVGPKIGVVALPWLAVTIIFSTLLNGTFRYFDDSNNVLFYSGLVILVIGLAFYFATVPKLLKGIKESKLVTTGAFYLCCNPLYASIILLIMPAISLMMNSWLVLTTSIVAYTAFKIQIRKEYKEMETFFGKDYTNYRSSTPEFFPLPLKKWFK